jgi:hypothetical protein
MALNGVYRFLYYFLMKKIPIKDVPSGLEDDVFDIEGVELGKYALQLPPPSDTKVAPADAADALSKPRYSADLSAIELQPLIQRQESTDIRIDGIELRFDGVDSKFNGMESRFDGVDSKFNGMESRFDGIEAKLNGILEALSKAPQ